MQCQSKLHLYLSSCTLWARAEDNNHIFFLSSQNWCLKFQARYLLKRRQFVWNVRTTPRVTESSRKTHSQGKQIAFLLFYCCCVRACMCVWKKKHISNRHMLKVMLNMLLSTQLRINKQDIKSEIVLHKYSLLWDNVIVTLLLIEDNQPQIRDNAMPI